MTSPIRYQTILGIRFFQGTADQAIDQVSSQGGLVVVPSGPGLRTLADEPVYREALLGADLAITDSGFMVLLWNLLHRPAISKLSGLKYVRALVARPDFTALGAALWVMPNRASADRALAWLNANGIPTTEEQIYLAPLYNGHFEDPALIDKIERQRPRHIVMGVGGNVQEPLGYSLKRRLSYLPAIHCIGAAIGFLTGDQVYIPVWTDAVGLGWLWRIFSNPGRFLPRYWEARHLARLVLRYGERLPID